MSHNNYQVKEDWDFCKAYIDIEEWRNEPIRHQYIHGGITGTTLRFSFYFPPKEQYEGRFIHFAAPAQGSEDASQTIHGEDNKNIICHYSWCLFC